MSAFDRPREQALAILRRAEEGVFTDALLDEARASLSSLDAAFIRELVYGVLRNRERLDWALDRFSERPVAGTDAWTRNILRLGAYQLLHLDRVPPSAAVNTSTELAKRRGRKPGYVNGLLRELERRRNGIVWPGAEDEVARLSVIHSHPRWLVRRWVARFGPERTEALLRENNQRSPLVIRTNTLRATRDELRASLAGEGVETRETGRSPAGLIMDAPPSGMTELAAYRMGWFTVQDEAAQIVSLLLSPRPGERVLDACAAPGGKATHLAELMRNEGEVVALELDRQRMKRISENSGRLGITVIRPVQGDAASFSGGPFDKVLVDAPCSGLGVLRRHPDGRWTKGEKVLKERQALQKRILENCSRLLKPGGALVYATCTTEPEENEEVVSSFLRDAEGTFAIDPPLPFLSAAAAELVDQSGFFRTFPADPRLDGFFGVRIRRSI